MVFGNIPIPSMRFCKFWFFSIIATGLFIYPALTLGLLNLGGKLPGLDGVKKVYTVKNKIAGQFQNKPVLYVVGGSSVHFGINADLMEKRLGRTVVNYGVHAGLGFKYQIFQLKKVIKPGDSVLLAFELDLLSENNDDKTDFLHAYITTYDKHYYLQDDWKKLWKAVYNAPLSDWELSIAQWEKYILGKDEDRDTLKMPHLLIGERGDAHYKQHNSRPLVLNKFVGLGRNAETELKSFISYCSTMGMQIYFSWETAVRHPDYFDERANEYKHSFLSFLRRNNIVVLDDVLDHLYPESFYSNSYNHLNTAGRRIRTEKLIQSIQNLRGPENKRGGKGLFLIDVENHETVTFDSIKDTGFDYRVYTTEETADDDTINNDGIQKLLNSGRSVYFNDTGLKRIPAFQNADVATVEVKTRTLQDIFYRCPDHLFFLVQSGSDLPWRTDAYNKMGPLEALFTEEGNRVAVIGSGRLSDVKKVLARQQPIVLDLKKGDTIGSFRFPFNVRLESRPISPPGQDSGRIKIGDASFFVPSNKPGIWCVVYDPELEVVTDRFFYESPGKNIEAELYCVKRKAEQL